MRQSAIDPLLIPTVLALAREAGHAIMEIYAQAQPAPVERKADDSPLTQADLAAHHILVDGLRALGPGLPVVSEEDDALSHRARPTQFWLIDPLDGTKEFLARNGEFTVNIALVNGGRPVFGIVFAPALKVTYWGGNEVGAWRESGGRREAIHVAAAPAPDAPVRVVASKSHLNDATRDFIDRLGMHELVQAGSSLKFCRVAEGVADLYPRLAPTCEWDTAAAQAVLEAAGGHVFQPDGSALRYGKDEVLNPSFIASAVPAHELAHLQRGAQHT